MGNAVTLDLYYHSEHFFFFTYGEHREKSSFWSLSWFNPIAILFKAQTWA